MTVKGGTSQACAACKYQRRKCSADCALSKYFPPDKPKQFQNAHKLFGVSNILKILKNLDPAQKDEAMRSIVYQANMRDKFPVLGCCGIIINLQNQVRQAEQELEIVNAQLTMLRQQHHHHQQQQQQQQIKMEQHHHQQQQHQHQQHMLNISAASSPSPPSSQLQLGTATSPPSLTLFHYNQQPSSFNIATTTTTTSMLQHHDQGFGPHASCNSHPATSGSNGIAGLWVQQLPPGHMIYDNNTALHHSQQHLIFQASQSDLGGATAQDQYDEISPFFDTIEDRQSYIDSKEAYDSRWIS